MCVDSKQDRRSTASNLEADVDAELASGQWDATKFDAETWNTYQAYVPTGDDARRRPQILWQQRRREPRGPGRLRSIASRGRRAAEQPRPPLRHRLGAPGCVAGDLFIGFVFYLYTSGDGLGAGNYRGRVLTSHLLKRMLRWLRFSKAIPLDKEPSQNDLRPHHLLVAAPSAHSPTRHSSPTRRS